MAEEYKEIVKNWGDDSREVAETIIGKYGAPDEYTKSHLTWYNNGPWAKTVVYEEQDDHYFPMKHTDSVEMSIFYCVPYDMASELARFDGSVTYRRTPGMLSAKCHDEEANLLAINLAHDITIRKKTADVAREFYVQAMKDHRAGKDVPYMKELQFEPLRKREAQDPDEELVTKEELDKIEKEHKQSAAA
jgi:hypothetical protein